VLSTERYDDTSWLGAVVPGTALASYLKADAIPDPNFDDWQFQISEAYFTSDFWYRNHFFVPADWSSWSTFLKFDAINWKADVYLNGELLPNANPEREHSIEGAFIRGEFNVSSLVKPGAENYLAVRIYKNDTPGLVTTQGLAEGPGPNGGLLGADNPTLHAAVGWDWLPTIRGRDIGIYGDVWLTCRGVVEMVDPWIDSDFIMEETSAALAAEDLTRRDGAQAWSEQHLDSDGESFVFDLGQASALGCVTLLWGSAESGAAADISSRHPETFRLETSLDGSTWANFDAYPGGSVDTRWFGVKDAEPSAGRDAIDGHAISDSVQGGTAFVPVDLAMFGQGIVPLPIFAPQTARYIRFTVVKRRELNGAPVETIVQELRVYAESPELVEQSMTRTFALDPNVTLLTMRTEVRNNWNSWLNVEVSGTIRPGNIRFKIFRDVAPNSTRLIERAGIPMKSPKLWWPNTYGEPFLYTCDITVKVNDHVSDKRRFKFGIKKYTYTVDGGILSLYCNGTRIVCKGGNWGMDDGLKLDTPQTYDHKVRLHRDANMTMIRNWIGMTNNDAFYDACDKYGIMVWDDFWLANPVDGPDPTDPKLFIENAEDKIRRARRHPSLAVYCGRNEGNPPPEIDAELSRLTTELDGTHFYFPNSASAPVGSGGGYSLAYPGGDRGAKQYFNDVTSPVLRSERGIPNVPALESIRKFVAPEHLWPISETWALHDWTYHMNGPASSYMAALQSYLGGDFEIPEDNVQGQQVSEADPVFAAYKKAVREMCDAAGDAWTIEDFSRAAQMINFENHHALFDALAARRSNGLLMWMSQSSWPSFMWQTYDWYLDTNGGYFGTKKGNQPTRAVWDPRDDAIIAANHSARSYENAVITAEVFDLRGKLVSTCEYSPIALGEDASGVHIGTADFSGSETDIVFLRLTLRDEDGNTLGDNTYWHNRREYQNYRALSELGSTTIALETSEPELVDGEYVYTINAKNIGDTPSVQTRLRATLENGADILPVFYSDNYFALMPGESVSITAVCAAPDARFIASGWNVE
jgi:hypothetical protein